MRLYLLLVSLTKTQVMVNKRERHFCAHKCNCFYISKFFCGLMEIALTYIQYTRIKLFILLIFVWYALTQYNEMISNDTIRITLPFKTSVLYYNLLTIKRNFKRLIDIKKMSNGLFYYFLYYHPLRILIIFCFKVRDRKCEFINLPQNIKKSRNDSMSK